MQAHAPVLLAVRLAHRRAAAPEVPVHALRHGDRVRTAEHRVRAVRVAEHLGDVADHALLQIPSERRTVRDVVSLVAHAHDDAGLASLLADSDHLLHRVRHRLLHVDVHAMTDRQQRGERVVVVGRRDEHGIERIAHLVEHHAVVGIDLRGVKSLAAPRLRALLLQHGDGVRVRLAERHDLTAAHDARAREERPPPVAAPDDGDADLRARCKLRATALSEARAPDVEDRQRANRRRSRKKRPSRCIHDIDPFCSYEDG